MPFSSAFIAFSRGLLGGMFILLFRRIKKRGDTPKVPLRTFIWLIASGAMMGFNWILLFEAYEHTTVAVATLCYYMQPTIVMLLSQDGNMQGVLLGLGAAVLYSVVVIMNKKVRGVDAYQKTTIQLLSAGAAMIPYMLLTGGFDRSGFGTTSAALLLAVGIVHTGIAYVMYFGSMDGLKAQSIAILSYIDPVSALLFSAVFLKEPLSLSGICGAVMIIGSAAGSELQTEKL